MAVTTSSRIAAAFAVTLVFIVSTLETTLAPIDAVDAVAFCCSAPKLRLASSAAAFDSPPPA